MCLCMHNERLGGSVICHAIQIDHAEPSHLLNYNKQQLEKMVLKLEVKQSIYEST